MKLNFYLYYFFICISTFTNAQNHLYKTDTAKVQFNAAKTSIEPIAAKQVAAKIILDTKTGDIASLLFLKNFEFPNKLMQEHFNENYLESDQYPKAVFTGTIEDFTLINFSKPQTVKLIGNFTIHGVTKKETLVVYLQKQNNQYLLESNFTLHLKDYNIKIPSVMFYKIAEKVEVSISGELKP